MEKCLSGDAFTAKIPSRCKTRRSPWKDNVLTPSKQQKLVSELVPYVVVINPTSDGNYPSDLILSATDEAPITSPCVASIPPKTKVPPKAEETQTVPSTCNSATTDHTTAVVAGTTAGGTRDAKVEDGATGRRNIFDKARASSSEMEWTSDESDYIAPAEGLEGLPRPLFSIECGESFTTLFKQSPLRTYRKKWSEEEHACLVEGVRILGEGKWKEIKNMYREVLKDRDTVHLKDRFRNTEGKRGKKKEMLRSNEQGTVAL